MGKSQLKIGGRIPCPVCDKAKAKIVWISKDGKAVGVYCEGSHPCKGAGYNARIVWRTKTVTIVELNEKENSSIQH